MKKSIFKKVGVFAPFLAAVAMSGCGGSGGGSNSPQQGPVEFQVGQIYISDDREVDSRLVTMSVFSTVNWRTFGSKGASSGKFNDPHGLCFDKDGKLLIADTGNHRIVRMNDMAGSGWVSVGTNGTSVGQFLSPMGVAVDSQNRIYVADFMGQRIIRMDDMNGTNWTELTSSPQHVFGQVRDVVIDKFDKIYVLDISGRLCRMDDMTGAGYVSLQAVPSGGLANATDLAINPMGTMFVVDSGQGIVHQYSGMDGSGHLSLNAVAIGQQGFSAVTVDTIGRLILTDHHTGEIVRIQDLSGEAKEVIGSLGNGVGKFFGPGRLVVRH